MGGFDQGFVSRRGFVGTAAAALVGVAAVALAGCGGSRSASQETSAAAASAQGSSAQPAAAGAETSAAAAMPAAAQADAQAGADTSANAGAKASALVVYFSHTGENYGVGYIEEGNTAIVAKMIAEKTGADMFEVVPSKAYPEGYDECCDVALDEQHAGARPAYEGNIDISAYDTVYLGYPIWWGDLPMCLYTFIEDHDWAGKSIHPFCTHAGSGLSGTVAAISGACAGATVGEGLAITGTTAQNERGEAEVAVNDWLA